MIDYATLARIEDHLRRIADASERIADALEATGRDSRLAEAREEDPGVRLLRAIFTGDPLDEDDHRPRHDRDGEHVYRHGERHWHNYGLEDGACDMKIAMDDPVTLAHYNDRSGPLTFCDCDDAAASMVAAEHHRTNREGY